MWKKTRIFIFNVWRALWDEECTHCAIKNLSFDWDLAEETIPTIEETTE
jgi:hypothetical protein